MLEYYLISYFLNLWQTQKASPTIGFLFSFLFKHIATMLSKSSDSNELHFRCKTCFVALKNESSCQRLLK